jgi:hypothetical protein
MYRIYKTVRYENWAETASAYFENITLLDRGSEFSTNLLMVSTPPLEKYTISNG